MFRTLSLVSCIMVKGARGEGRRWIVFVHFYPLLFIKSVTPFFFSLVFRIIQILCSLVNKARICCSYPLMPWKRADGLCRWISECADIALDLRGWHNNSVHYTETLCFILYAYILYTRTCWPSHLSRFTRDCLPAASPRLLWDSLKAWSKVNPKTPIFAKIFTHI